MKKLLLLDADVIIDLHSLDLFKKIEKSYEIFVTVEVINEAKYYIQHGKKKPIDIKQKVTKIENVKVENVIQVEKEAKEAGLAIDPGESTSIAYLLQTDDDIKLCSFDKAAIKLISYMNLEQKSISLEYVLKNAGQHITLSKRHSESAFKKSIRDGKTLRIYHKKLH